MIRRYRRRGWRAQWKRLTHQLRRQPPPQRVQPLRALPERLQFIEEYHYQLTIGQNTLYEPEPERTAGEVQIDLPFDRMGREAMADVARATSRAAGPIVGRVGWLALTHVARTDIPSRFGSVRGWGDPAYTAFPLELPLLDERTAQLAQRIEGGWHEREVLYYTPQAAYPFPFRLSFYLSRDAAVPVEPPLAREGAPLPLTAPTGATGKAMMLHVEMEFALHRPSGVIEADTAVTLDFFMLKWPTPPAITQFALRSASGGSFRVDSRFNQLIVEGARATLTSTGTGPLRGFLTFALVIEQPSALQGVEKLEGSLKLGVAGVTLSGVRAQFFDALGVPRNENDAGEALVQYRTDVVGSYSFKVAQALTEPPHVLERTVSWVANLSGPDPWREIEETVVERGFTLHPDWATPARGEPGWWATRQVDGRPFLLEVRLEKRELPRLLLPAAPPGEAAEGPALAPGVAQAYYELTVRSYYRGPRDESVRQLDWLEELLRQRLYLRLQPAHHGLNGE